MTRPEALAQRLGKPQAWKVIVLDALRKQRNLSTYSGDTLPLSTARDCGEHAEDLLELVSSGLADNKPDLLE